MRLNLRINALSIWFQRILFNFYCITAIIQGITMGLSEKYFKEYYWDIFVIPGLIVTYLLVNKYRRGVSGAIASRLQMYCLNLVVYSYFTHAIINKDKSGIILNVVFLSICYLLIPLIIIITFNYCLTVVPRATRNEVANDYTPLQSTSTPEDCVICQENMEENIVKLNNCSHKFHENCIVDWLIRKRDCPICREGSAPSEEIV